jgi:hypothetical protein
VPFRSKRQARWMFANRPEMAKRWADHTPDMKELPEQTDDGPAATSEPSKEASMGVAEKYVEAMQIAAVALQRAETQINEKRAADVRYQNKLASVIEAQIRARMIDDTPHDREKMAEWLSTPDGALEIIEKMAQRELDNATVGAIGQPVDGHGQVPAVKKANYIGRRSAEAPAYWDKLTQAIMG